KTKRSTISILPREFLPAIKSEEFLCSCGRCASDFFQRSLARTGDLFCHQSSVSRLTASSAKRHRGKVRTIGFNHETIERQFGRDFADLLSVLERDNAGEGNEVAEAENLVRLFECAAETMEHAAQLAAVIAQNLERVGPGVALMNDNVQSQLDCK